MKALIICSVHALCDIAALERAAFNAACAAHGIPSILTAQDIALSLETSSMLGLLAHLPVAPGARRALAETYLDLLDGAVWSASIRARRSVLNALRTPDRGPRPIGFVSDYPLLTTNLIRAGALGTDATKLGHLTVLPSPSAKPDMAASLTASAASLTVAHGDVEVLVAHRRNFSAARKLGMQPRLVAELRSSAQPHRIRDTVPKQAGAIETKAA